MCQPPKVLPLEHVPSLYSKHYPLYRLRIFIPLDDLRKRVPNLPDKDYDAYRQAMVHYVGLYNKNEKLAYV